MIPRGGAWVIFCSPYPETIMLLSSLLTCICNCSCSCAPKHELQECCLNKQENNAVTFLQMTWRCPRMHAAICLDGPQHDFCCRSSVYAREVLSVGLSLEAVQRTLKLEFGKLCRAPSLPEEYVPEIKTALAKIGQNWEDWKTTDNSCKPHPPVRGFFANVSCLSRARQSAHNAHHGCTCSTSSRAPSTEFTFFLMSVQIQLRPAHRWHSCSQLANDSGWPDVIPLS